MKRDACKYAQQLPFVFWMIDGTLLSQSQLTMKVDKLDVSLAWKKPKQSFISDRVTAGNPC